MQDIYNSLPYLDYMLKFIISNCHGADFPVLEERRCYVLQLLVQAFFWCF